MRSRLFATLALGSCLAAAGVANAQTGDAEIDKGIALYNDLEYEQATVVLAKAVARPGLGVAQKTEGYKTLALSYVAMGKDDDARAAFRALLDVNPSYELRRTENPKALDLFDEVKKAMAPPTPGAGPRVTQAASPLNPMRGGAITVSIGVVDEARTHASVVVHHRVRGQRSFSSIKASRAPNGRYTAVIPGAFVEAPAVEYYVVALDASGEAVAAEGSADEPLRLDVGEDVAAAAPFYAKWWFWGGVAGAVVAGAALGFVMLSGDESGSDQATVNVTVNYMPP